VGLGQFSEDKTVGLVHDARTKFGAKKRADTGSAALSNIQLNENQSSFFSSSLLSSSA
jgi:hypothetical protein